MIYARIPIHQAPYNVYSGCDKLSLQILFVYFLAALHTSIYLLYIMIIILMKILLPKSLICTCWVKPFKSGHGVYIVMCNVDCLPCATIRFGTRMCWWIGSWVSGRCQSLETEGLRGQLAGWWAGEGTGTRRHKEQSHSGLSVLTTWELHELPTNLAFQNKF